MASAIRKCAICLCPCFFKTPETKQIDIELPILDKPMLKSKPGYPTTKESDQDGSQKRRTHRQNNQQFQNNSDDYPRNNQQPTPRKSNRSSVHVSSAALISPSKHNNKQYPKKNVRMSQGGSHRASVRFADKVDVISSDDSGNGMSATPLKNKLSAMSGSSSSKDEFLSFKDSKSDFLKSSSFSKKSLKVLRFRKPSRQASELFESVNNNICIEICDDEDYRQIMESIQQWTQQLTPSRSLVLNEAQIMDLDRVRKIALGEASNKIEEFEMFAQHNNMIYSHETTNLKMDVELKESPKTFQNKIYTTLCKISIKCPMGWFMQVLNSPECQAKLSNFSRYSLLTKDPHVLLEVREASNFMATARDMTILKFSQLVSEQGIVMQKKYLLEIDKNVCLDRSSSSQQIYKRIVRVYKVMPEQILEVHIHTETNIILKQGVLPREYFSLPHKKLVDHLTKMLRTLSTK